MTCFACFLSQRDKKEQGPTRSRSLDSSSRRRRCHDHPQQPPSHYVRQTDEDPPLGLPGIREELGNNISAQTFTFRELASATRNFRQECLIGEGGFGRVYKGLIERTGQIVAVKQLDRNGVQGNTEFRVEVSMLSLLNHENLVNLIGYCADGDQRLLVYEFMPLGSVEEHLLDLSPDQNPLSWGTRMKIAVGAAKGLEYLHEKANPPVIYRDMKTSNILIDQEYNAKLSDFGLAKVGPVGDKTHVSSRIMGTYGYCAPEYQRTGQLTVKTDIYSFGVVFLELITGQRAIDITLRGDDQLLVNRAQPIFKDPTRYSELADPLLRGDIPSKCLNQAVAVAAMCLQEDPSARPLTSDIVTALMHLWESADEPVSPVASTPTPTMLDMDDDEQDKLSAQEREEAVAEAIEWGSRNQNNSIFERIRSLDKN